MENRYCLPPKKTPRHTWFMLNRSTKNADFPLWRANKCRTHFYLRHRKAGDGDRNIEVGEFWRNQKNMNRLETYKQREIALPVHVKEKERRGGGADSPPPFWKQRGRGEKKSTHDRKRKCQGSKRKWQNLETKIHLSQVKDKNLKRQQKSFTLRNPARSQGIYLTKRAASAETTWARAIAARTRPEPRPPPLPSAPRGGHVSSARAARTGGWGGSVRP